MRRVCHRGSMLNSSMARLIASCAVLARNSQISCPLAAMRVTRQRGNSLLLDISAIYGAVPYIANRAYSWPALQSGQRSVPVLSYSDLLFSIAVANWRELDARREVNELIDALNGIGGGFSLSKDFVLKAGLMLAEIKSVGFKVENFDRANIATLETAWPAISRALDLTVQLVSDFGFTGQTLRADSALLPIAYYLYKRKAQPDFLTHSRHANDRRSIMRWLARSYLKASGIWGSGLDTLLTSLRDIIAKRGADCFPWWKSKRR
jgi:hypothetical protein